MLEKGFLETLLAVEDSIDKIIEEKKINQEIQAAFVPLVALI
jgi:hypothetical protein